MFFREVLQHPYQLGTCDVPTTPIRHLATECISPLLETGFFGNVWFLLSYSHMLVWVLQTAVWWAVLGNISVWHCLPPQSYCSLQKHGWPAQIGESSYSLFWSPSILDIQLWTGIIIKPIQKACYPRPILRRKCILYIALMAVAEKWRWVSFLWSPEKQKVLLLFSVA